MPDAEDRGVVIIDDEERDRRENDKFILHATVHPREAGTITPHGKHWYPAGKEVMINVKPHDGWNYVGLDIDGVLHPGIFAYPLMMDRNHTVIAVFEKETRTPPPTGGSIRIVVRNVTRTNAQQVQISGDFARGFVGGIGAGSWKEITVNADLNHDYSCWVQSKTHIATPSSAPIRLTEERPSTTVVFTLHEKPPSDEEDKGLVMVSVYNNTGAPANNVVVSCSDGKQSPPASILKPFRKGQPTRHSVSFEVSLDEVHSISVSSDTHKAEPANQEVDFTGVGMPDEFKKGKKRLYRKHIKFNLKLPPKEKHWRQVYSTWSVAEFLPIIALAAAGLILSLLVNSFWFIFGFLSWIMVYIIPGPSHFLNPYDEESEFDTLKRAGMRGTRTVTGLRNSFMYMKYANPLGYWPLSRKKRKGRHYMRSAWLRGFFKGAAIFCLGIGFQNSPIVMSNLIAIIVVFFGYYNLGVTFNRTEPGEYIESLIRFIIGLVVIPFFIVWPILNSFVLVLIALAFFGIPPILRSGEGNEKDFEELPLKIWFALLMIIALLGSGALGSVFTWAVADDGTVFGFPTWGLGAMAILGPLFLWFWLVTAISGFFSPSETRPYTGFLMLGAAILIFALGPGTADVGSAFFGQYFPTIYQGAAAITQPLADMMGIFGDSFGNVFLLLSNPTAYAQSIVNGSFQKDPDTGLTGAFGVELTQITTTPIFANQPYQVILKIQNKGAFEARNVYFTLEPGAKSATTGVSFEGFVAPSLLPVPFIPYIDTGQQRINIRQLGFPSSKQPYVDCVPEICAQVMDPPEDDPFLLDNTLAKFDSRQVFFQSDDTGISCPIVNQFTLREKPIPFRGRVFYDYQIESNLVVESISSAEWDRLVAEGTFIPQAKKAASLKNAPVRLNLDTLEQPIREGTPFFLGISLGSAKPNGRVVHVQNISVEIPIALGTPNVDACLPQFALRETVDDEGVQILHWTHAELANTSNVIYCQFKPLEFSDDPQGVELEGAERTFVIAAKSYYSYEEVKEFTPAKIEFGGTFCCDPEDDKPCPGQLQCNSQTQTCGIPGTVEPNQFGGSAYCANLLDGCEVGFGGCSSDPLDCNQDATLFLDPSDTTQGVRLACRTDLPIQNVAGEHVDVCCPAGATVEQCTAAWNAASSTRDPTQSRNAFENPEDWL